jgi:predicted Zn-ribbon and HTH transcriptional regulator
VSFVQRTVAHCDQCHHEWIVVAEKLPTHCARCKSRQWNAGEKVKKPKRR